MSKKGEKNSMREAFELWMVRTARTIVGSNDPHLRAFEDTAWRVWQAAWGVSPITEPGNWRMRDVDEIVRELRVGVRCDPACGCDLAEGDRCVLLEAADVIERLRTNQGWLLKKLEEANAYCEELAGHMQPGNTQPREEVS